MSLKAKLEAVIYAAEEPVTLAQLAMIFAGDALAWKAEREAARVAEAAETAAAPVNEAFDYVDTNEAAPEPILETIAEPAGDATPAIAEIDTEAAAGTPEGEAAVAAEPEAEEAVMADEAAEQHGDKPEADPLAESRRAARQRDREVRAILRTLLDEIVASYAADGRGIEIREVAGGFRMATKPEFHDSVRAFVKSLKPPLKLSLPALETLAVIAYKQPVTAPEVNEIRGVDSSAVFGSLLARKLIATAGRKPVIGRPILYKTTREFLLRFGLKDVSELPSMEEFEKMAASELEEFAAPEAPPNGQTSQDTSLELDENASEEEPRDAAVGTQESTPAASRETTSESNPSESARAE